jgi:hypothetical protein
VAGLLASCLLACGPVRVGDLPSEANAANASDAGASDTGDAPSASIRVRAPRTCGGCFELVAEGQGGEPPYTFEWEDSSRGANRRVCTSDATMTVTVTVRDANGARSSAHSTSLEPADAGCPQEASVPKPLLCVRNGSFEGTAAYNSGLPTAFDAMYWDTCTSSSGSNTPDIVNDSIKQWVAMIPKATDGDTYLGLAEDEQASQRLCESVPGGSALSFALDLTRLNITAGLYPDTEKAFLEVWGGTSAGCSTRELLWASAPLTLDWQRVCITIQPQQFMDSLFLRANSDDTQLAPVYLLVDHLVPVTACPQP